MKRSILIVAAVSVVLVVGLWLFSRPEETKPAVLLQAVVGVENDLTTLDPIRSQEPYTLRVIGQIFEGLVTLDSSNRLQPVLAESWSPNPSFDTWTFRIRKGVYFHDDDSLGSSRTREVNAQDVIDSFERIVSKDSYPAFVLADTLSGVKEFQEGKSPHVSGLRAVDAATVEMKLVRSEPAFLHRITSPWFVVFPREATALGPDVFGRMKAVGTGPFRLVTRTDTEVVLERNPHYWRKIQGNLAKLTFRVVKNEQLRLSELKNGRLDVLTLPPALVPAVAGGAAGTDGAMPLKDGWQDFRARSFTTFNSHFIGLNCDKLDLHLRRAISLGVNRNQVLNAVANGAGRVSAGTVPVGLLGYEPPYAGDLYDPSKAREELRLSSFNPAKGAIELLVHEKDGTELIGQLVQGQLKEIGIPIKIQRLDYNTVVGRMIRGETEAFALSLEYVFSAPETILENIFASSKIPVPNFWHFRNDVVDSLFGRLRSVGDRQEANRLSRDAEKEIIDGAPAVFLYQVRPVVLYRSSFTSVALNGHSIPLFAEVSVR